MTTHADNAIDNAENEMPKTRGPRAKFFICAAWKTKEHKNVLEPVEASSADEAKKAFFEKHGFEPDVIDGGQSMESSGGGSGYYLAKGTGMTDSQRISVTVNAEHMRYTTKNIKAEYQGWVVYGNGIRGFSEGGKTYKDNDLFILNFDSPVGDKVAKPKLKKSEAIRRDDLKIIAESD